MGATSTAFVLSVAHELIHVFDAMRFVVPAFQNWDQFWKIALREGSFCDVAIGLLEDKRRFLDNYGSDHEKEMIAHFWPSKVEEWFAAMHG